MGRQRVVGRLELAGEPVYGERLPGPCLCTAVDRLERHTKKSVWKEVYRQCASMRLEGPKGSIGLPNTVTAYFVGGSGAMVTKDSSTREWCVPSGLLVSVVGEVESWGALHTDRSTIVTILDDESDLNPHFGLGLLAWATFFGLGVFIVAGWLSIVRMGHRRYSWLLALWTSLWLVGLCLFVARVEHQAAGDRAVALRANLEAEMRVAMGGPFEANDGEIGLVLRQAGRGEGPLAKRVLGLRTMEAQWAGLRAFQAQPLRAFSASLMGLPSVPAISGSMELEPIPPPWTKVSAMGWAHSLWVLGFVVVALACLVVVPLGRLRLEENLDGRTWKGVLRGTLRSSPLKGQVLAFVYQRQREVRTGGTKPSYRWKEDGGEVFLPNFELDTGKGTFVVAASKESTRIGWDRVSRSSDKLREWEERLEPGQEVIVVGRPLGAPAERRVQAEVVSRVAFERMVEIDGRSARREVAVSLIGVPLGVMGPLLFFGVPPADSLLVGALVPLAMVGWAAVRERRARYGPS